MPNYLSEHVYIGNGSQTDYIFNKGYLSRSHVLVKVSADGGSTYTIKADPSDYEWVDSQTIRFDAAPAADAVIWLDRETPRTIDINYDNGTVFTDTNQNHGYRQAIYILQEMFDELERRPSLGVQLNDIEETLAQVVGNISLSEANLLRDSFDLKALIGRNDDNRMVISLSKENPTSVPIPLPGGSGGGGGGIAPLGRGARIADYSPTFFGENLFYDIGAGPVRPGVVPDEYLNQCSEWDGTFFNYQGTGTFSAGYAVHTSEPPADTYRDLKIRTASGQYTNLHTGRTSLGVDGNDWITRITPWFDPTSKYGYQIVYKKPNLTGRFPPPWGTYVLVPSNDAGPTQKTSAVLEGVGNNFPSSLQIERF